MKITKKRILLALAGVYLIALLAAALCFGRVNHLVKQQHEQFIAEQWQGESDTAFCQYSCFFPVTEGFDRNGVGQTRNTLAGLLLENAYPREKLESLFTDAWSGTISLSISNERVQKVKVNAATVGGNFFQFHPVHLVSGSTLSDEDFSANRILVDADLAWQLYGSTQIEGQLVFVNDRPFSIAGVYEANTDEASKAARPEKQQAYVLYSAFLAESGDKKENPVLTCYELVMPEPVTGFARQFIQKAFPSSAVEKVQNTGRFSYSKLYSAARNRGESAMRTGTAELPPWENAARYTAAKCGALLHAAVLLLILPAATFAGAVILLAVKAYIRARDELLPAAAEQIVAGVDRYYAHRRGKNKK
ncbi:MAG: ABC transporter permease [Oscillospiraceae bacterium]|nr:ABC transporter permease [Oscillospiraceae bacterium]